MESEYEIEDLVVERLEEQGGTSSTLLTATNNTFLNSAY